MKKILLIFISSTILSCGSMMPISDVTKNVYIGMTESQFLSVAGNRAEKDAMNTEYYVYRINQYDINGYKIDSMFYYFDNNTKTLFEVSKGKKMD